MRRIALAPALVLLLAAAAGCSDDSPSASTVPTSPPTSVDATAGLPAPVQTFLDGVAAPGTVAFRATYRVLRKLGGGEQTVEVLAEPPSWQVRTGDLVFVDGPEPATCRVSARRCVGELREALLAPAGVFSRFFSSSPAQALATDARREGAAGAITSSRTVAGLELHCLAVPIGGATPATYCLTADGVFGWADTPSLRYELVSYRPGPTGEDAGVPYELTADDDFLGD